MGLRYLLQLVVIQYLGEREEGWGWYRIGLSQAYQRGLGSHLDGSKREAT